MIFIFSGDAAMGMVFMEPLLFFMVKCFKPEFGSDTQWVELILEVLASFYDHFASVISVSFLTRIGLLKG